ncbi:MAG: hypothetical protein WA771_12825, partial [Chthoniobacterales bacterium]
MNFPIAKRGLVIFLTTVFPLASLLSLDLNSDGVSDVYEANYPPPSTETFLPSSDFDGDGASGFEESIAGTDWRSPLSRFATNFSDSGPNINWFGVLGIQYGLQHSETLLPPWDLVGSSIIGTNAGISLPLTLSTSDREFWRVAALGSADLDEDSLDAYEEGLLGTSDSSKDSDSDGNSDTQEFIQQTDPTDGSSFLLPEITKYSGDSQTSAPNTVLALPLVAEITMSTGEKLFQVPVTYSVTAGGGALLENLSETSTFQTLESYTRRNGQAGVFYQQPSGIGVTSSITASVRGGNQTSSVTFTALTTSAPANDMFVNALSLSGVASPYQQNTSGATKQASEPSHADTIQGASVWYSWT